ncbi:PulJ/GspJ family protein [Solidesulfovibrio sp.]
MTRPGRNDAGFTLVEVLLALLIAALVMLGSYSVTSQVMGLSEDVQANLAAEDALAILRLTLTNDLGSTIWADGLKADAAQTMAFYGGLESASLGTEADRLVLSLATAAVMDPGAPFPAHAFNRVEYVLRPLPDADRDAKTRRQLVRREIPLASLSWRDSARTPVRETVLLEDLTQCAVRFYAHAATAPLAAWDSRNRQSTRLDPLPAQVRLSGTATFSGKHRSIDAVATLPARTLSPAGRP